MAVTAFVDTNVVVYAASGRIVEPEKYSRAQSVLAASGYATSAQVHAEFYHIVTTKNKPAMSSAEALEWLDDLRRFPVVPLTSDLVVRGAEMAQRYQLSYWDGAILAAANAIGANTLYTEDLNDGQLYGSVRVLNPFIE